MAVGMQRDEIVRALHGVLSARMGAEVVCFCLVGPSFDRKEWLVHARGPLDESIPAELQGMVRSRLSEMSVGAVVQTEVPTRVLIDSPGREEKSLTGPLRSSIVVPMVSRDQLQGLLAVASTEKGAFSDDAERLLDIFAGQAAIALENEAMFHRVANMAVRDGLTGLFNHRHFYEVLQLELERSERYSRSFSLVMIDADALKSTNDTFGHLIGDRVLRELAALFLAETRESDVVARYGGDEFAIILPESSIDKAQVFAERLRRLVEARDLAYGDRKIVLTISVGVTSFVPGRGMTVEELVRRADRALYRAKSAGRNRVCVEPAS